MKDELLMQAQQIIKSPNILINVVSRRVKQLRAGAKSCASTSFEKLDYDDLALKEIIEGKLTYELYQKEAKKA